MNTTKTATSLIITVMVVAMVFAAIVMPASAATEAEIEQAISDGVAYIVSVQNADGSWGSSDIPARTAFVLMKLEERATELGLDPFDNDPASPTYYEYADNVTAGMDYLLGTAQIVSPLPGQTHGNPDANGNGQGIYFGASHHRTYTTGLAACALGLSAHPDDRSYNIGGTDYTYKEIAQDVADWLAFAQTDSGAGRGGWVYDANDGWSDNSNSGYATLGLDYAEEFGCTVPQWVKSELNIWIDYIQNDVGVGPVTDDGGSGYESPDNWVNILKTGNLLQQMVFCGDDPSVQRVQDAVDYLERHWKDASQDPGWGYSLSVSDYQAMFTTMKGLETMGINLIDTDGDGSADDDWFNQEPSATPSEDFASAIVAQQNADGSWPQTNWDTDDRILSCIWALLTLEKVAPPPPPEPCCVPVPVGPGPSGVTGVPLLTPFGAVLLIGLLAIVGAVGIRRRRT